jgi:hypothetical protein
MAYFAELDSNLIVLRVIKIDNEVLLNDNNVEEEQKGIDECIRILGNSNTTWKQTSYNNSFRGNYAGPGYKYDDELDIFIAPLEEEMISYTGESFIV